MESKMPAFSVPCSNCAVSLGSSSIASFLAQPLGKVIQSVPSFRFHPTDEELVLFFLKKKMCGKPMNPEIIPTIDIYKWNPEDLPALSWLKTRDRQWFFLTRVDRKYRHGLRSNRNTGYGLWKITGNDRNLTSDSREVGIKKTLVFYKGKATKDDRTDWVMHEYTLSEDELRRCQDDVQDHYALCKVFKKSGYGPKNGEQYGAPFREEDWTDSSLLGCSVNSSNDQQHIQEVNPVDMVVDNGLELPSFDDINFEELRNIFHEVASPPVLDQLLERNSMRPEVVAEDLQGVVKQQFPQRENYPEPSKYPLPNGGQQHNALPGVEYASKIDMEIEGGITIDELDLLPDAEMFLRDVWSNQETLDHSHINTSETDVGNENYQLLPIIDANQIGGELWMQGERNITNPIQDNYAFPVATPGMVCESTSEGGENQSCIVGGVAASSLSSILCAFVESIPTTPASACENAIVNETLEQMSTLTRVRDNIKQTNIAASNGTANMKKARRKGDSFLCFWILVGLFALFWVFIPNLRLLGSIF